MKVARKRAISPPVEAALQALGGSVRAARLARTVPIAELALRTNTSPATVKRIERGDPSVSMGAWAACLSHVGLLERAAAAVAPAADDVGEALRATRQRKRARRTDEVDNDF